MSSATSKRSVTAHHAEQEGYAVVRVGPGCLLVAVPGDLNDEAVGSLRAAFGVAATHDASSVILDARDARFADKTALDALVQEHARLRRRGGSLTLVSSVPTIHDTLRLTGLAGCFPVRPTLDAALDAVAFG